MDTAIKKYIEIREKVGSIRNFYLHLIIFIFGILFLSSIFFLIDDGKLSVLWIWMILTTMMSWLIGLGIHSWSVFGSQLLFSKKWEERRIRQYLERTERLNKKGTSYE